MKFCTREILQRKTLERSGEVKLGQSIACLSNGDNLDDLPKYVKGGIKYALIGIPESIGIRGNFGRSGAERAWDCFLNSFLNMQSNHFMPGGDIICLGQVYTDELQAEADRMEFGSQDYIVNLRDLCARLDDLVHPVITKVVAAGLIPIIIGGGHNNVYPILKGFNNSSLYKEGVNCINCDAHADFRSLEGRHSGNGFSYAVEEGLLKRYFVLGMHESYNSEAMFKALDENTSVGYTLFDEFADFAAQVHQGLSFFEDDTSPLGLELDLDCIAGMSASAFTPSGISIQQARSYIINVTRKYKPVYFHLSEGAPSSQLQEQTFVGKSLAYFVCDFIKASNWQA